MGVITNVQQRTNASLDVGLLYVVWSFGTDSAKRSLLDRAVVWPTNVGRGSSRRSLTSVWLV